jgi:poly(U)-specific endoribonuclease
VVPTTEEINDISFAVGKLWELDVNRLSPGTDYIVSMQGGHKVYDKRDTAKDPLYSFVDAKIFERPTFRTFVSLLDNYVAETGVTEVVTREERAENSAFLNRIMETYCMQYCHNILCAKGLAPRDNSAFIRMLNDLWFGMYRREAQNDSSAFEHVFLGEIRDGSVCGMHNWIQIYNEERRGSFNYMGYITPKRQPRSEGSAVPATDQQLVTIQFEWRHCLKPASTSFIGKTSRSDISSIF